MAARRTSTRPAPRLRQEPERRLSPAEELLSEELALSLVRFGVRAVAENRRVSERTLRRQFEREGVTVQEHVAHIRLEMARRLLVSRRPMCEIAGELGFASTQTFDRFVHREMGLTPTSLRRALRGPKT